MPESFDESQETGAATLISLGTGGAPDRLPTRALAARKGAHARPTTLSQHGARLSRFSLIGGFVFIAGTAMQWALVHELGADWSYVAQSVFSIELSYVLNRLLTWGDRATSGALWRWNVQRIGMTVPNLLGYDLLVWLGLNWLLANIAITAVFTAISYMLADRWSFADRVPAWADPPVQHMPSSWMPNVSVVVPCKNNQATIGRTVESLLAQDYPNLAEVIVVGDVGDSTWAGLSHVFDPRLVIVEHEHEAGRRDPNVKRHLGLTKATGEVLALADSDIVMDRDWLSKAVSHLRWQGHGLVAGGMRSIHDSFWGRFVDGNLVAAKTPRLPRPYLVTAANFGKRGNKPPITANAVFFREMYEQTPLDTSWFYGYEDYEWFWRAARAGHRIFFDGALTAAHHHRRSFRKLLQEYRRSAEGCAWFVRRHPDSPLARKRKLQAVMLPLAAPLVLAAAILAGVAGYGAYVGGAIVASYLVLAGREIVRIRRPEALAYPAIGLSLAAAFTLTLAKNLTWTRTPEEAVIQTRDDSSVPDTVTDLAAVREPRRSWHSRISWPLAVILAVQAAISVSLFWSNTAFGDEALYLWAGHLELQHWLHGTSLVPLGGQAKFSAYFSGAPMIYPPLAAVADSLGGLAAARALSLVFMLLSSVMLYLTAKRLFSGLVAYIAVALCAVEEPWLKIGAFATYDAMAVSIITVGIWMLVRARDSKRFGEIVALGAFTCVLGSIISYSYAIFLPAVIALAALCWREVRGTRAALVAVAWLTASMLVCYVGLATVLHLWSGLLFSIYNRGGSGGYSIIVQPVSLVVGDAWSWQGIVMCLAALGAVVAFSLRRDRVLLLVLAASCLLVPAEQAHLRTGASLDKHLSLGIWLASMAAAYGVVALLRPLSSRKMLALAGLAAFLVPAITGYVAVRWSFRGWPNEASVVSEVHRLGPGNILFEGNTVEPLRYMVCQHTNWVSCSESWVPPPVVSPGTSSAQRVKLYRKTYNADSLRLVIISFGAPSADSLAQATFPTRANSQAALYSRITSLLAANPDLYSQVRALDGDGDYRLAAIVPEGQNASTVSQVAVIWQRVGTK